MAQGILRKMYAEHHIEGLVDSAGFESYHINDPPDDRALQTALEHGIDLGDKRARLFSVDDFDRYDRIYVMDVNNYNDVMYFARDEADRAKVDYLMNVLYPGRNMPVPDPYYRDISACNEVFLVMEKACERILELAKPN